MASQATSLPLDTDVKRQALYASLLRFDPATAPLREVALDRIVLGGLLGSNETTALKMGLLQKQITFGPAAPALRSATIQQALDRLVARGYVGETEIRKKRAYYITTEGTAEIAQSVESGAVLFERVLTRLLRDTAVVLPYETGAAICRAFFCEFFARFGRQFAHVVSGRWSKEDFVRFSDVNVAFDSAVRGHMLSPDVQESLLTRCTTFLKSDHPDDQRLKFYLTQGYYFAQLLGFEGTDFQPLAEQAYNGAVFYIDTNVLLPGLLMSDGKARLFAEMVRIAATMGIELRVTRATVNELRRVTQERVNQLARVATHITRELAEHSRDEWLLAFIEARDRRPDLSPEEFMSPAENITATLDDLGIQLDDRSEDEVIAGRDYSKEAGILQEESARTRRGVKSERTLAHDVAHLALVMDERRTNSKTWFLTMDRAVGAAARRLAVGDAPPASFSLMMFLESISPFLTVDAGAEHTLVALFSRFLSEQVFPLERVFDTNDLAVLADMYEDVFVTPHEQLVPALDYVKLRVLNGRPVTPEEGPRVALELRKYLTHSNDEKRRLLETEKQRLIVDTERGRLDLESERCRREAVEADGRRKDDEIEALKEQVVTLRAACDNQQQMLGALQTSAERELRRRRRNTAIGLSVLAGTILLLESSIAVEITSRYQALQASEHWLRLVIRLAAILPALIGVDRYVRQTNWSQARQTATLTAVVAACFVVARLGDLSRFSVIADLLTDAAAIVALRGFSGSDRSHDS